MQLEQAQFVISVHHLDQLPSEQIPEIAFAGRSNVGKSSLLNALLSRKNLVKVSGRPGKTQGLNFFLIDEVCHFVDLPGYGYAKVSKGLQAEWGKLISAYLSSREQLRCVVVLIDIRHEAKQLDGELLAWLRSHQLPYLVVYTKADKLSGNQRQQHARILDIGHGLKPDERLIFSSTTLLNKGKLIERLQEFTS